MKPGRTFWRVVIAVILAASVVAAQIFPARSKLVTDVFSLLDDLSTNDADRAGMREVVSREGRVAAMRLDGPCADEDAGRAASYLVENGGAARADVSGIESLSKAGMALFENRTTLLFPRYLAVRRAEYATSGAKDPFENWLADRAVADLDAFLAGSKSLAFSEIIPNDPLLLMPQCADVMPSRALSGDGVVVMAETSGPSTNSATQKKLLYATDSLRKEFAQHKTTLHATGAAFFAHESEARIRADIVRLNAAMTVLLLALLIYYLRSIKTMLAVILPVFLAWMMAIVALFVFQSHIYAMALGIGGIIGGISVDCPVHIMLHRREDEATHVPAFARLLKPMALGALASISVFAFLMLSDLPLIRQTGLLVGCGLAISYFTILPCFAAFSPSANPETVAKRIEVFDISGVRHIRVVVTCALLFLAVGCVGLRWNDSTDTLQPPLDDLYAENDIVLGHAKQNGEYVVSFGRDFSEAVANARASGAIGLATIVSTDDEIRAASEWQAAHGEEFQKLLNDKLDEKGYDSASFKPLFEKPVSIASGGDAMKTVTSALPAGFGWMVGKGAGESWIVSRIENAGDAKTGPITHTYKLDVRAQLSSAFKNYRTDVARLALIGFAVASIIILAASGIRRGAAILSIPILSIAATLGVFGIFGPGLNLFNIIGMLLGYGLSMDYALFANHPESARASIRFSAYTTMTAFAALVISVVPAVRGIGLGVLLVLFFTLLQCETRPLANPDEHN